MIPRFTDSLEFHSQALVLRAERQRIIAGNIANADTPGYKARDFEFSKALRSATASSGAGVAGDIGSNIASNVMAPGGRAQPRLDYAQLHQTQLDNNTVDMDRERGAFVDNAVKYEATLRFVNSAVRGLQDAMKSHNQG